MATFSRLLTGGDSGPVDSPSRPDQSRLIGKLKGTAPGMRMTTGGQPPLDMGLIAKFAKWITEAANSDGPDDNLPIEQLEAIVFGKRATHEELNARRVELANSHWELGWPGLFFSQAKIKHFCDGGVQSHLPRWRSAQLPRTHESGFPLFSGYPRAR